LRKAEFSYHLQRVKFTRFSQNMEFARRKFSFVCEIRFARYKFGALREAPEFGEQICVSAPHKAAPVKAIPRAA